MRDPVFEQRFWSKVRKSDDGGCWEWTGARCKQDGKLWYGVMRVGSKRMGTGKVEYAHRIAWLLTHWLIPRDNKFVLHRCDNPACVRPDHLFLGTHAENMADMDEKGRRQNGYTKSPPTHCKRGHEFTSENTAQDEHGNRRCRACSNMWGRVYRLQRRAA